MKPPTPTLSALRQVTIFCMTAAVVVASSLAFCPEAFATDCATQLDDCLYQCAISCGSDTVCLDSCDTRCEVRWMRCTGSLPIGLNQVEQSEQATPEDPTD